MGITELNTRKVLDKLEREYVDYIGWLDKNQHNMREYNKPSLTPNKTHFGVEQLYKLSRIELLEELLGIKAKEQFPVLYKRILDLGLKDLYSLKEVNDGN